MVNLSNADDHVLRMSQLAAQCHSSLSRLSHVVARLERRGWLRREPCPDDGRATLARMTDDGFAKLASAAPGHVEAVRALRDRRARPGAAARAEPPSATRSWAAGRRHAAPLSAQSPPVTARTRMPAAFLGHGNPMNALDDNRYTQAWRAFGAGGAAAAGDPGGLGALVHQRHGRHRHAPAADDPRLLRLPAARCSTSSTRRPAMPELAEEVTRRGARRPGSARTSTAGASTTAPGRCSCTPSPTPTCRSCS